MFSILEIGDILVIGRETNDAKYVVFMHDRSNENYISVRETKAYKCKGLCAEVYETVGNDNEKLRRCYIAAAQVYGSKLTINTSTVNMLPELVYDGFVNIEGDKVGFCPAHFCIEHQQNTQEIAKNIITLGDRAPAIAITVFMSLYQMLRFYELVRLLNKEMIGNMYIFNSAHEQYEIVTCFDMPEYNAVDLKAETCFGFYANPSLRSPPPDLTLSDVTIGCVFAGSTGLQMISRGVDGQLMSSNVITWETLNDQESVSFNVWYNPMSNGQPLIPSILFDFNNKLPLFVHKLNKMQSDMDQMPVASATILTSIVDDNEFDSFSSSDEEAMSVAYDTVADDEAMSVAYDTVADDEAMSIAYDTVADDEAMSVAYDTVADDEVMSVGYDTVADDEAMSIAYDTVADDEAMSVGYNSVDDNEPDVTEFVVARPPQRVYQNVINIMALPSTSKISLIEGDITKIQCDAIVNAANTSLLGGGGVDHAIHAAAGRGLLDEARTLGGANTGEAKITHGYNLPAQYVIHAVGPIIRQGSRPNRQQAHELAQCYVNSLALAVRYNIRTIVFPSISTGAYNYPIDEAADVALSTIRKFLDNNRAWNRFDRIGICLYSKRDYNIYRGKLRRYF
ncbi:ORF_067R [Scale drop disease virus]|uniref:ORF_067R n=1 Tax=Scale drop disease virus TaxID=1697349 RepID=A0A0K1L687_9VIRU|nr:ORF_067R [Scale drop disease virus]AKU37482.1 ORF_067R [Scale drop disease virus]UNH60716.1 ADP-ribose glycohydrolase [Scale drop disease virus]